MRYTGFFPYSLFPIPYSLFPIPYSLFPIPCSLKPTNLYLTLLKTAVSPDVCPSFEIT
ncbi:MAG: hypothetical protein F6J90_05520 [Moorea sp. SIOASIH]|uniref:hypothetical protein n=1 Tax=Moorena sp. SIOASIH TaxID=2607817 RepID=UPI0013B852FD|nr:hypothetical protein [Moorena sp. SIOASIH]NEO35811.1 hypothetical protein [Moorena sp. SIOASIH]